MFKFKLLSSSRNFHKNGTFVLGGTLVLASELDSATGHGSVVVQGGTMSGTGGIVGSLKVGTGSGSGAILDPGNGTIPGTLAFQNHLILNGDATYNVLINSNTPASDQVTTKGIIIRGASVSFQDVGTALLPAGTTFTVINNQLRQLRVLLATWPTAQSLPSAVTSFRLGMKAAMGTISR